MFNTAKRVQLKHLAEMISLTDKASLEKEVAELRSRSTIGETIALSLEVSLCLIHSAFNIIHLFG